MLSFPSITRLFLLWVAASLTSSAQSSLTQALQPVTPASTPSGPTDPLGRTTPSNSITGFLKAATAGDYSIAAQYLQMSAAHRQSEGAHTAAELKMARRANRHNVGIAVSITRIVAVPRGE